MNVQARGVATDRRAVVCPGLEIVVLFTEPAATLQALRTAAQLAAGLSGHIRLLVPNVVPYPLPLEQPAVGKRQLERRFRTIAAQAGIETRVDIRLCREATAAALQVLSPHSLVGVGLRRRRFPLWWPAAQERAADTPRPGGCN